MSVELIDVPTVAEMSTRAADLYVALWRETDPDKAATMRAELDALMAAIAAAPREPKKAGA